MGRSWERPFSLWIAAGKIDRGGSARHSILASALCPLDEGSAPAGVRTCSRPEGLQDRRSTLAQRKVRARPWETGLGLARAASCQGYPSPPKRMLRRRFRCYVIRRVFSTGYLFVRRCRSLPCDGVHVCPPFLLRLPDVPRSPGTAHAARPISASLFTQSVNVFRW